MCYLDHFYVNQIIFNGYLDTLGASAEVKITEKKTGSFSVAILTYAQTRDKRIDLEKVVLLFFEEAIEELNYQIEKEAIRSIVSQVCDACVEKEVLLFKQSKKDGEICNLH